jgi:hypothetical protein
MPTWMMGVVVPFLSHGMDSIGNSLTLFICPVGGRPCVWRPEIRIFLGKVGSRGNDGFHEMPEITFRRS